jgi:ACS family glucarate transporter-like MFS transporter
VFVWIGCHTANNWTAILLVATGAGFNMAGNVTWWAACVDLAPRHSGSLSGLMNMCGGAGGWLAPILTGYIAAAFGWTKALDLIAVLSAISGLLWMFINVETKLERELQGLLA